MCCATEIKCGSRYPAVTPQIIVANRQGQCGTALSRCVAQQRLSAQDVEQLPKKLGIGKTRGTLP